MLAAHGRRFERRWIRGDDSLADDPLLNAADVGCVADAAAVYESASRIRGAPVGRASVPPVAIAVVLPLLPVFAAQLPIGQVLETVLLPLVGL